MPPHGLKTIPSQRVPDETQQQDISAPLALSTTARTRADAPEARRGAQARRIPVLAAVADLIMLVVVCLLASALRQGWNGFPLTSGPGEHVAEAAPVIGLAWLSCNALFGAYSPSVLGAGTEEFRRVAGGAMSTLGIVGVGCYLFHFPLSRGFLGVLILLGAPMLIVGRIALRGAVERRRRQGALLHRVLVAGGALGVDDVVRALNREPGLGFRVVGAALPNGELQEKTPGGVPVVASTSDLVGGVASCEADVLFLATGSLPSSEFLRDLMWDLEELDVQLAVAPAVSDVARDRVRIRPVGGLPLVHIDAPRGRQALRLGKRAFDVVASTFLLLLLSPILAAVALWIRVDDAGPVFFRQRRVGRDGADFWCLKFRTMVTDAESLLPTLLPAGPAHGLFKLKNDPRITRAGARLRRFSLDELPQLINVWRGEMSLVGPRPPLREEVERYPAAAHRRLRVRPGLTGLWQVSGRSDLPFDDAIRLDLYYVDNWSVFQDISILWKTVGAVIGRRGAY